MEEYQELNESGNRMDPDHLARTAGWRLRWWCCWELRRGLRYGYRQQLLVGHLTAQQTVADSTISQMQGQLNAVTSKLNDMTAAQARAQAQAQAQAAAKNQPDKKTAAAGSHSSGARRTTTADKRYKALQSQLADQQKELKDTQDLVAKNRADLEGNISSTRDELNGSIAKTHEELVVLEKRGEQVTPSLT